MKFTELRNALAAVGAAAALFACAHTSRRDTPADQAIVCVGKEQCEVMWGRATIWVAEHSGFALLIQAPTLIQTEGPVNHDPAVAMRVMNVAMGNGKNRILFTAQCGNMFGCSQDPDMLRAAFAAYVSEAVDEAPSPIGHTIRQGSHDAVVSPDDGSILRFHDPGPKPAGD